MDAPPSEPALPRRGAPDLLAVPSPSLSVGRRGEQTRFSLRATGIEAAGRLLGWLIATALLEALGRWRELAGSSAEIAAQRERRRARAATRLARLLGDLKGPFVKAGQFAALRYDVLPAEARSAFEALADRVSPLPFARVRATLEAELGDRMRAFASIDPIPLGTASIAQVHRARLADGREVAMKVQHPGLAAALPADLAVLRIALRLVLCWPPVRRRLGALDAARLFDEFATGIADEYDFEREARIAREIAANLAEDPRVVVPAMIDALCTSRVLTMAYHAAIPILDRAALDARGVRPCDVLEVLARAYAKQVFVDGSFHADPHPGNLFVIDEPAAARAPRVLFVDFGLSRRLSPALRRGLRKGIFALLQRDADGFLAQMNELQMIAPGAEPGVRAALHAMFERVAREGATLALGAGAVLALKDEAKRLLQQTPGLQLPNDLLLFARTLSHLFALGESLDPEVDLMALSLPALMRFLAATD